MPLLLLLLVRFVWLLVTTLHLLVVLLVADQFFIPIFFIEKCHFEAAGGMMACNGTGIQTGYFNCYAHFNSTRFPYSSTSNLIAIILTFLLPLLFLL